jgi:hypothetical protein
MAYEHLARSAWRPSSSSGATASSDGDYETIYRLVSVTLVKLPPNSTKLTNWRAPSEGGETRKPWAPECTGYSKAPTAPKITLRGLRGGPQGTVPLPAAVGTHRLSRLGIMSD